MGKLNSPSAASSVYVVKPTLLPGGVLPSRIVKRKAGSSSQKPLTEKERKKRKKIS